MQHFYQKTIRIIGVTVLIYALLMATHLGEFWPFSIYPMFSQAGKPWKRALVRDVTDVDKNKLWNVSDRTSLVGTPVSLKELNINTNDIANLLSKTDVWNERKVNGLKKLFTKKLNTHDLLLMQARGRLLGGDTVDVKFHPYLYLSQDTTILNKNLRTK